MFRKVLLARLGRFGVRRGKHPSHCTPPFNLKYLQALLERKGAFEVRLLDALPGFLSNERLVEDALAWAPQLIVLLVNPVTLKESQKFISRVKERKGVVVVGMGDIRKKYVPQGLDVLLPGEGEVEAFALIERIQSGQSSVEEEIGRYRRYKEDDPSYILVDHLDDLPFPQYDMSEFGNYRFIYPMKVSKRVVWGHILSSRGCPYPCSFCSSVVRESFGSKVRLRSAANVVDEMESLMAQGVNMISFDDDLFTVVRGHVESVCREISERGLNIQWIAHSRVDNVDRDLLKTMKEAGCVLLRFGVESGSPRILTLLQKTPPGTNWNEMVKQAFAYARGAGIATHALILIGNPEETEEDIQLTFDLIKALTPDGVQAHFFTPYPGSKDYEQWKTRLKDEDVMVMYHYDSPFMKTGAIDIRRLRQIRSDFYRKQILNPEFAFRHLKDHFLFYIHNPDVFWRLIKGVWSLSMREVS